MKVIEFLAGQLDREIMPQETQTMFEQHIEFWNLCVMCKELLNDKNNSRRDSQMAA